MQRVAFLYNTPHPAHRIFADSVDADYYSLIGSSDEPAESGPRRLLQYVTADRKYPRNYDCYLVEGGRGLVPARILSLVNPDATIIYLNADETFLNLVDGLDNYGHLETSFHQYSLTAIDGVISVGEFVDGYLRKLDLDVPSRVVYPSIKAEVYDALGDVGPAIDTKTIVSIGEGKPAVGFDILVAAFEEVREDHPDAELHIGGEGHPDEWNDIEGVTVHGWVEDLQSFFSQGSLSSHPGRSECFPVSTLEPMRAGLPCLVSDRVGTKQVVNGVSSNLVVEPTIQATANAISWYFDLRVDRRRALSADARKAASSFTDTNAAESFARAFKSLCTEIASTPS